MLRGFRPWLAWLRAWPVGGPGGANLRFDGPPGRALLRLKPSRMGESMGHCERYAMPHVSGQRRLTRRWCWAGVWGWNPHSGGGRCERYAMPHVSDQRRLTRRWRWAGCGGGTPTAEGGVVLFSDPSCFSMTRLAILQPRARQAANRPLVLSFIFAFVSGGAVWRQA